MCGLFGWHLEPKTIKRRKRQVSRLATALMLQNSTRGDDSWGFYSVEADKKVTGIGDVCMMPNQYRGILTSSCTVIGHTRKATTGSISHKNCHPFRIGSLVGAHNGIVFNHHKLNTEYDRKCNVDSEHIFYHLSEGRECYDITAYGAIVYHDKTSKVPINFACFDGEFAYCVIKNIGVVWSSDKEHLEKAISLAGWTGVVEEPHDDYIYSVELGLVGVENTIYVDKPKWSTAEEKYTAYSSTGSSLYDDSCYDREYLSLAAGYTVNPDGELEEVASEDDDTFPLVETEIIDLEEQIENEIRQMQSDVPNESLTAYPEE